MAILSDTDIDRMRATVDTSLGGTAILQTRSIADDLRGGGTISWTASGTVPCRLTAAGEGREPVTADRITPHHDWVVTMPAETTVTPQQRIVTHGRTLEVVWVSDRTFPLAKYALSNEVT